MQTVLGSLSSQRYTVSPAQFLKLTRLFRTHYHVQSPIGFDLGLLVMCD